MNSRSLRVSLVAASAFLGALLLTSESLVLTPTPESEPNNTPVSATALTSAATCQAASGSISPAGDLDYYSFTAPPGARVWALVDTSPSPAASRDSILRLFGPDGTTQIELDDDDGLGTNCDGTIDNFTSSTIAGRVLSAGGTYYLRVEGFGTAVVTSYKLTVVVTSSAQSEVEANNSSLTANPIATAGTPIGVRDAAITPIGDVDFYSVVAPAGSTLFISADGDPERNGGTDIVVDLIQPNGTTVILSADSSDNVGFPAPPAESFCYNVTTSGTYFVRVSGFTSSTKMSTGTYSLMVAVCGLPPTPTPTPTVTQTSIPGVATATPTPTLGVPTATRTATAPPTGTSTPIGGLAPSDIPTLSFPMLLVMAMGLLTAAFVLIRRS